jgi:hypothetical protein
VNGIAARMGITVVLMASLGGCGLTRLDEEPGSSGVPPAVQDLFSQYCAISSCHDGSAPPTLLPGQSDAILGMTSTVGTPYVEFGNLQSHIAVRLLDPNLPMPPLASARQPTDAERAIIIGWIAGAPFDDTDGGSTGGDTEDTDPTNASSTTLSPTTTTTTDSTTGDPTDDTTAEPTYANVQAIFDRDCALGSCHDGTFVPNLQPDVALDETIDVVSMTAPDGAVFIARGSAADSYLVRKLTGENIDGVVMPFGLPMLPQAEIDLIRDWIDMGANP